MKNIIAILLFAFVIISCSPNEDNPVLKEPLTTKMDIRIIYTGILMYTPTELQFNFEYDKNQRLTKKIGGVLPISSATGFGGTFTDKLYTSLTYSNNIVTVENYLSSTEFYVPRKTRYFTLNSLNQIDKKEIPHNSKYWLKKQTFSYIDSKLSEIKTVLPDMPYDPTNPDDYELTFLEKFYYDTNGNLIKTEYFEQHNGINKGEKVVRIFEDYDNAINPTKRLQLLDEFFYRSLSKNNFTKYTEVHYYLDVLNSKDETTWTFNYDSNGQILVTSFLHSGGI